jgi:hypothetical protein
MTGKSIVALLLSTMVWSSVGSKVMSDESTLDPSNILFSLATICDPMPAFDEAPAPAGARWLHEDDWRQIEFVAVANRDYIGQQLESLALFKQQHRRGSGWDAIYPRAEHPTPLAATGLHLDKDQGLTTSALTIGEPARPVRGGFTLSDGSDWFIYGQRVPDGQLNQLGLQPGRSAISEEMAGTISQFARAANLMLVDWYRRTIVDTASPQSIQLWAAPTE